eukprot:4034069-Pyramimonas_sp.AAC.1
MDVLEELSVPSEFLGAVRSLCSSTTGLAAVDDVLVALFAIARGIVQCRALSESLRALATIP